MPTAPAPPRSTLHDPLLLGTAWVLLAAVGYTASNVFLRRAATTTDPAWACCIRAMPILVLALVGMARQALRGRSVWPTRHLVLPLTLAGISSQLLGNAAFQHALGVVGLAITVPLTFSTILVGGAILGRLWLGESITPRAVGAMGLLCLAIVLLSFGAGEASHSVVPQSNRPSGAVAWALVAGCASGIAYAGTGVVIRRSVVAAVPVATIQFFISVWGVVGLGLLSAWRLGLPELLATPRPVVVDLLWAGGLNFLAFLGFGLGLKQISVVHANAVNSSQIAMAALAGVLFFGEPPSLALVLGLALTLVGLALMQTAAHRPPDRLAWARLARAPRRLAGRRRSIRPSSERFPIVAPARSEPLEETVA